MTTEATAIITIFEQLGIPVGFLVLMYILYVKTQAWNQKITEQTAIRYQNLVKESQDRYEELTNRFIDTTNKIIAKNAEAIQIYAVAMHELSEKVNAYDTRSSELLPKITAKDEIIMKMQRTVDDMYQFLKEMMRKNSKH